MSSIDDFAARLLAWIQTSEPTAMVQQLAPLAGGASRETWQLDVTTGRGLLPLILRMDQASSMNPDAIDRPTEYYLLEHMLAAGVQVPRPFLLDASGSAVGRPAFLMERVEGESIGVKVLRRPELAASGQRLPNQMAQQLAKIHAADIQGVGLGGPPAGKSPAEGALASVRALIDDRGIISPALEFGWRWLSQRAPACPALVPVHGDFRIGNLIVGEDGLRAVIDWEFAHIGDPHEDLAWPCVRDWRFGNDALPVGGVGEREPFFRAYEQASGRRVSREAVQFWEILGNLRWAATCRVQALRHLSGADPSIEYASLGRRAAEMELEMLSLIR